MVKDAKHRRNEIAIGILANNIKKYRKSKNLTIQELANILNVDYSQISRMERGVVNPNISIIFDIAGVLGIEPGRLLEK
jgi:transcriptional regulator with XRE-family HTH domain